MKTLVIDLAFGQAAALVTEKTEKVKTSNEKSSDKYMLLIDSLLAESGIGIEEIDQIAVNVGPGSFTGLRVAIAVAKGLGFGTDVKFKTFNSFDLVDAENVVLPGFSNFVYTKMGGKLDCKSMDALCKRRKFFTPDANLAARLKEAGVKCEVKEKLVYSLVLSRATECKLQDLEPLYLRKSQAELDRAAKQKTQKQPL